MIKTIFLAIAAALVSGTVAMAHPSDWMVTGGRTSQPIGHYELCQRSPIECDELTPRHGPYRLTRAAWRDIVAVNTFVNTTIKPMSDMKQYGVEDYWTYPNSGYGDCEDYALLKRRLLMREGIPTGDLLMTVVRRQDGEGHAVLTVHTNRGDFILDNLNPRVRLWWEASYHFLKRQSETDSGIWVSIDKGGEPLVGSIRR